MRHTNSSEFYNGSGKVHRCPRLSDPITDFNYCCTNLSQKDETMVRYNVIKVIKLCNVYI